MGKKLGKKARKFARKNLQAVQRKKRKLNSVFNKRRAAPLRNADTTEENERAKTLQSTGGICDKILVDEDAFENHLDDIFNKHNDDVIDNISDSDGFLSEDSGCPYISESESVDDFEERNDTILPGQNNELHAQCTEQRKKLERLLEKDPGFSEFLERQKDALEMFRRDEISSGEEDDTISQDEAEISERRNLHNGKVLTSYTLDVWCWLVVEQPDGPALPSLLNVFRAACRYGAGLDDISSQRIPNGEMFSKILTFVLSEADGIFRSLLNIGDTFSKESVLKLENTSKWEAVRPLIKSYLRNSLFLLNQVTDGQILVFALSQLRASIIFFASFPSLTARLIKISVHLWSTGDDNLSLSSLFILRDIALHLSSEYFDSCLANTYKAFIGWCKFVDPTTSKRKEFLMNSIIELFSLDIQKSYQKALISMRQLAYVLRQALKTRKKEDLKKIYNWQYINCVNLWVKFITCNSKDHDLRPLLFMVIQVIRGIAGLLPGPRYLPLRFSCVQMLNSLSLSSGIFIPVASLVFDCLEHRGSSNADKMERKHIELSSLLKVPKYMLKSRYFEEECILSAIELLVAHFAQWSYHISFPELATIAFILLKRFHEKTTAESLRRPVKRLIDQVEINIEFIRKKRDEVSFSPNDHASVDSFLQLEKIGTNVAFTQYYASILRNSCFSSIINKACV